MTRNLAEYTLDDYLMDENFIQWVYSENKHMNKEWSDHVQQFPEKKQIINEATSLLWSLQFEKDKIPLNDKIDLSKNIQKRLDISVSTALNLDWGKKFLKYAASVIIIIGLTFAGYNLLTLEKTIAVKNVVKENTAGQKSTITLPDGSTVKLNAESILTYGESFNDNLREVNLQGEAFFMVVKNPDVPFVVKTGDVKATVLGTSFNVRNFKEDTDIEIALSTGSLRVEGNDYDQIVLVPSEMSSYSKSTGKMKKSMFDESELLAWKDNTLCFKQANLLELERELERWFGVNIVMVNKPSTPVRLSSKFTNQSLENILETLKFTLGFEHEFLKDKVNVQFK